jgi:hypothetical protein
LGIYSFGGFSQQLADNIPLPENPLTSASQVVETNTSLDNTNVDQAVVNRLMNEEGLDIDTATLIAQIDSEIKSSNSTFLNYEQTLEDEGAWDVQIRAIPDQTYILTEAELQAATSTGNEIYDVEYYFEEIDGTPQFTFRYFVPYEAMSEELKTSIQSKPSSPAAATMVGFLPSAEASGGASGAVIETIIKNLGMKGIGQLGDFSKLYGALGALTGVYDLSQSDYFSELEQLRECAENPTNPLTKKTYQENPSEKAKTVEQVNEAQSQVEQLMIARILNLAAKTGAQFTGANFAGKLFFDSVAKWNDETLKQVSQRWVDDARKAVVRCEPAILLNGSIQYRVSSTSRSEDHDPDCPLFENACYETKEQRSGSGDFFVALRGSSIIGNGTGTYEETRTRAVTKTPDHPLTEYNGEYHYVISGNVPVVVEGAQFPTVKLTVKGGDLMTEQGSSTNYVLHYGDSKVTPVTEGILREVNSGFVCYFEGVDLVKGATYKQVITWGDTVVGSCEMQLFPG